MTAMSIACDISTGSLLMVEDSDLDFELARLAIKQSFPQISVYRYASVREVMQNLSSWHTKPVMVLLDLRLPDGRGTELARMIRQRADWRHVPIVIYSTSTQASDAKLALDSGANAFRVKPIDAGRYISVVTTLIREWASSPRNSDEDSGDQFVLG